MQAGARDAIAEGHGRPEKESREGKWEEITSLCVIKSHEWIKACGDSV